MKTNRLAYLKSILTPCLVFSTVTGVATGVLVFCFRVAANAIISLSASLYAYVRQDLHRLPFLLIGVALLGLFAALILRQARSCRGGGIPTAVALLRGLIHFDWIKSIFALFAAAMLSYLGGLPLGNEGPCVQMGTAVGRGTVRLLGKKNPAWDRYIMTGGACAGFAAATGAPISGIFFAFEEAHRRFSPMIFMTAATSVIASTVTAGFLCGLCGMELSMFSFADELFLPTEHLWAAAIVGAVAGICAILFTVLYRSVGTLFRQKLKEFPFTLKLVSVFVLVALVGIASPYFLGSGHDLIEELLHGRGVWYLLLLYFCVRTVMQTFATHAGATGGLFVPSLAYGAMVGALCAEGLIALGWMPQESYAVFVVVGMASFLSASSRTPIMAITFAAEVLCGFANILPVVVGATLAFLVIEGVGMTAFSDTVIEGRVEADRRGKTAQIVDTHLIVREGSFAVGKEIRDILWPPACVILSVQKNTNAGGTRTEAGMAAGDVLRVHYQTFDPAETAEALIALLGKQEEDPAMNVYQEDENHRMPEQ
ncbi:MAG: chloride channel protein [Clostridia bacterium]|nr:chloride channel protein [Clostridia bacterium]